MNWFEELLDRYNPDKVLRKSRVEEEKEIERDPRPRKVTKPKVNRPNFNSGYTEQLQEIERFGQAAPKPKPVQPRAQANTNLPTGNSGLSTPLSSYRQTSGFGPRKHPIHKVVKTHTGVDLAAAQGTPIYATHDGVINFSGVQGGYGNLVIVSGANALQTYYAHQARTAVRRGETVRKGQVIGYVGSTGLSTGPHLHYEVRINGRPVNPQGYMP